MTKTQQIKNVRFKTLVLEVKRNSGMLRYPATAFIDLVILLQGQMVKK